jgi:hypothetical protein
MPSRVIKGEINTSDSLSNVSIEAELTFRALLLACDDYGRFDGRLAVLKAALFPLRDRMTEARIDACMGELEREGCLRRYSIGCRPYLCLPNWERHRSKGRRANASRYPDPPETGQSATSSEILGTPRKSEELHDRLGSEGRVASSECRTAADAAARPAAPAPKRARGRTDPPERWPEALRTPLVRRLWHTRPWLLQPDPPKPHCVRAWIYVEVERCLDWHRAQGKNAADWVAAAANWVGKSDDRYWPEGIPRAAPFHELARQNPEKYLPREIREAQDREAQTQPELHAIQGGAA